MNTKLLLVSSIVIAGIGYVLTNSIAFGLCTANEVTTAASCINLFERLGDPIFFGGLALSLVFVFLALVPKAVPAWKKFAIWFVPLAAILFIFYPNPGSGDLFSPYPEFVFKWVSILYVAISVGIITFAALRKNKR